MNCHCTCSLSFHASHERRFSECRKNEQMECNRSTYQAKWFMLIRYMCSKVCFVLAIQMRWRELELLFRFFNRACSASFKCKHRSLLCAIPHLCYLLNVGFFNKGEKLPISINAWFESNIGVDMRWELLDKGPRTEKLLYEVINRQYCPWNCCFSQTFKTWKKSIPVSSLMLDGQFLFD